MGERLSLWMSVWKHGCVHACPHVVCVSVRMSVVHTLTPHPALTVVCSSTGAISDGRLSSQNAFLAESFSKQSLMVQVVFTRALFHSDDIHTLLSQSFLLFLFFYLQFIHHSPEVSYRQYEWKYIWLDMSYITSSQEILMDKTNRQPGKGMVEDRYHSLAELFFCKYDRITHDYKMHQMKGGLQDVKS